MVDVVHCWNNGGKVRCASGKEHCCIVEYLLYEGEYEYPCNERALVHVRTLSTSRSWTTIFHSSSFSSNSRKPLPLFAVNMSRGFRCFTANSSILNVEFHLVVTSRGITFSSIFNSSSNVFQAGNRRVDELTIL
jgi:hypothetical protein